MIDGGGDAIGGATARPFAREGAHVCSVGLTEAKLDAVAGAIRAAGGTADTAAIDALDAVAVDAHAAAIAVSASSACARVACRSRFRPRSRARAVAHRANAARRAATLADVGDVAAFVASGKARTMTAATVNVSAGALLD